MRKLFVFMVGVLVCVGLVGTRGHTQDDNLPKKNVKIFMQAKLVHAQKVLEGLTTDDFDLVAQNSQKMSLLSLASTWQVLQTPEYVRRSTEFRHAVDALTKAAEKENLDGATLAYVNVTLKCVECHKYVRSVRNARFDAPDARDLGLALDR